MQWCAPLTEAEKAEFVPFLKQLIEASFRNIASFFLMPIAIEGKSNGTPVTEADKSTERMLREMIEARYPTHGIFGEEYGVKTSDSPWRWILDPIDGTRAFISHSFHFGTLIALEKRGDDGEFHPVLSTIAFAAANVWVIGTGEACELYRCVEGQWQHFPVHSKATTELSDATLLVTSHWSTPEQVGDERLQRLIDSVKLYRTWGDCFGYFSVATGGADIMIDPDLSYWDLAALLPVVEGAGAVLVGMNGGNPLKELSAVCCSNTTLLQHVRSKLQ